jgi:hypothetical protein
MVNQNTVEDILQAAQQGDPQANSEIYSELFARFLPIVSLNIQKYTVLTQKVDAEEKCREVCQTAISAIKKLYPLHSKKFSVKRAVAVLHNVIDDFIADALYLLAKEGDRKAEESLFDLLRKKLMIYVKSRLWKG